MNNDPFAIHFKLTHPGDQSLRAKLVWFLKQPGIVWSSENPVQHLVNLGEPMLGPMPAPSDGNRYPELQISRKGVALLSNEEVLRFHPSMALLRLINLERGEPDRFLEATGLSLGDSFLDATLGLGTDALVAAFAVGASGRIVGIEHTAILAALVKDGLETLSELTLHPRISAAKRKAWSCLIEAAPRIEVVWGEHLEFLKRSHSKSFDVVYFDPMFRRTRTESANIRALHPYAEHGALTLEIVEEACRVARRRVVVKERKGSREFARLGLVPTESGKYSPVDYGVIETGR